MLRWIGAALLVLCSSMISMNAVLRSRQRIRGLEALIDALRDMEEELCTRRTPLPELMRRLSVEVRQPAAELFSAADLNLTRRELPFSAAWEMALKETEGLFLLPEEERTLTDLGRLLGRSGVQAQETAIRSAGQRLRLFLELEQKEHLKKSRVRAAVGAGAGVMLAILLL
ncbi:MAG: stage III sporulation protein AB [Oscillospiraceae bacterium]|nr:stage III sporulation protein AB [Oscillospiraceae bacterium]